MSDIAKVDLDDGGRTATEDKTAVQIASLIAAVDALQADVARLNAQRPTPDWRPLKLAASLCGVGYETCRTWAHAELIGSRRECGRLFVDLSSLRDRVAMLRGGRRSG